MPDDDVMIMNGIVAGQIDLMVDASPGLPAAPACRRDQSLCGHDQKPFGGSARCSGRG
jgi:hypothetical protein